MFALVPVIGPSCAAASRRNGIVRHAQPGRVATGHRTRLEGRLLRHDDGERTGPERARPACARRRSAPPRAPPARSIRRTAASAAVGSRRFTSYTRSTAARIRRDGTQPEHRVGRQRDDAAHPQHVDGAPVLLLQLCETLGHEDGIPLMSMSSMIDAAKSPLDTLRHTARSTQDTPWPSPRLPAASAPPATSRFPPTSRSRARSPAKRRPSAARRARPARDRRRHRLRLAVLDAHRPPRARVPRLLRAGAARRAVGAGREAEAARRHPLRRPGQRLRHRRAD